MLTLVTPSSALPVTLDEAKKFLKMDDITDDDDLITMLLGTAVSQVENVTGRCLLNQTWKQTFDEFPCDDDYCDLYRSKVTSITSVKYYDTSGVQQTLSSSVYELEAEEPAHIRLKPLQSWPGTDGRDDGIEITFVAGYGATAADVPAGLKVLVLIMTSWLYENRQAGEFPKDAIRSLAAPFVVPHAL